MRNRPRLRGPAHQGVRGLLRVVGPICIIAGLILLVIGIGSFFASFGSFGPPRYFWCAFLGGPLLVFGIAMTSAGYMGAIARYQAGEIAPVAKDTFNYVADGTQDGIRTVAQAISEGLTGETSTAMMRCAKCEHENDHDARFCDHCGEAMPANRTCPDCGQTNDPDARFCDACGGKLSSD